MDTPTDFEWDDAKAEQVRQGRGIAFEVAAAVFLDPDRIDSADERKDYGEARRIVVGRLDDAILFVAYTMRGETCRIITAWPANRKQRRAYDGEV